MEEAEESQYEVIITKDAEAWFYEVLDYLYEYYSLDRAEEIANEIRGTAKSLNYQPDRGSIEPNLVQRKKNYLFILYRRSKRADIKIIYYVEESLKKVYVTDFFPTEKDPEEIAERSSD